MQLLRVSAGAFVVLLGALLFTYVNGYLVFTPADLFGWTLIVSGILFCLPGWAWRRDVPWLTGLFVPASLAFALGGILVYTAQTGWSSLAYIWLAFLIAPALALFAMYHAGPHVRALWWAGLLLVGISLLLLAVVLALLGPTLPWRVAGAIMLIVLGLGFASSALLPRRPSMQLARPRE